ncbi:unnamed protein product, partial [Heterotrigona itama]
HKLVVRLAFRHNLIIRSENLTLLLKKRELTLLRIIYVNDDKLIKESKMDVDSPAELMDLDF